MCIFSRSSCVKFQIVFRYTNWGTRLGTATNCDNDINKLSLNIIAWYFIITLKLCNDFIIVFKLTVLKRGCLGQIIHTFQLQYLNKFAYIESLNIFWKSVFKKILLIKSLLFWKKGEKRNEIKFWIFIRTMWTCYAWNKCNMENKIFFLMLLNYNSMQIQ